MRSLRLNIYIYAACLFVADIGILYGQEIKTHYSNLRIWEWGMGKYYDHFLWSALILTALREPLEQFPSGQMAYLLYAFLTGLFLNALQAYYFKKAGFLASLSMRLGHYLFWHILLGVYVQYFELGGN